MIPILLAAALGACYFYLRRKDPRMLRNGLVLVAACWFALVGVLDLLSAWFPWTSLVILGVLALTPLAVLVLAGFLLTNGVVMLRREGRSLGNLLSLVAGCALLVLPAVAFILVLTGNSVAIGAAALMFLLCSYLGVVFVVFLVYAVVYGRMPHSVTPAAIVILGSQIIDGEVPPLLRSRLDKGLQIYGEAPSGLTPLLVPSGGQGSDESRSEGAAMADYLVGAGVPAADVAAEEHAATTAQNLQFSAAVAQNHGRGGTLVVVTNNYHVLRAALLSRKLGIDAQVVGSNTAGYFLPSAFLREFVAVLKEHKWLHVVLCLPFLAITALLTTVLVLANQ